jgi:carbon starvation protein
MSSVHINALPVMVGALCVLAIGYRFYSKFIATKVLVLDGARRTPAHTQYDGHNYVPTNKWVLFGHHFAAITGAGPLIGPVLAAQFGFLPGLVWILIGVVLAGAVHDFVILTCSVRRGGRSLADMARNEVGPLSGWIAMVAILFIVVIALAGLGMVVVNALSDIRDAKGNLVAHGSSWGTFSILCSIPIALGMGFYMYRLAPHRPRRISEATAVGVVLLVAAVLGGKHVEGLEFSPHQVTLAMAAYGFIASVLPVWLLLCPRDYLSSFMKIGTIALLVASILWVHPDLRMPAVTGPEFSNAIFYGKIFPFVFITIACGAISGFHGLVASGTTPKMVNDERDCRTIGYGAMLIEGLVGVVALIAASSLHQSDYFAINMPVDKFMAFAQRLHLDPGMLADLQNQVGEQVTGRTGGGVTLAVGMAQIFSGLPGMRSLMSYWYHFAIMFEALFILTTIDTGTRVGRFLVQELLGRFRAPLGRADWLPGTILSTGLIVAGWTYFIWTGSVATIWPMFGIANQLLAVVGLAVATSILINEGKRRYAWVTIMPMLFVATTTLTGGWKSVVDNPAFWQAANNPAASEAVRFRGLLNSAVTVGLMAAVLIVLCDCAVKWVRRGWLARPQVIAAGAPSEAP